MKSVGKKVFVIGFNRCGTTSIHDYFCRNGISAIHWDMGNIALRYHDNIEAGRDLFEGYEDYTVFSDMVYLSEDRLLEPYKDFEKIALAYPDAHFILNTRDCDKWMRSRHRHPDWTRRYKACFALESKEDVDWHWRQDWHEHHGNVLNFFRRQPGRLLVYNIEQDSAEKLCSFFEPVFGKLNPSYFRKAN